MLDKRNFALVSATALIIFLSSCHSGNENPGSPTMPGNNTSSNTDDGSTRKVSVVISSIPFPSSILDTLHSVNAKFDAQLTNPVGNTSTYTESNSQAANLGVYGADLSYVISFEQFQSVGAYMKTTKSLADNIGIPLAFTEEVIERCEKNQNNKDSLTRIVFQSYNVIDQTLKQNERTASEVLVLLGGWVEGAYLTSESLSTVPQGGDKEKVYGALLGQKQYVDKLIQLLNAVNTSAYCHQFIAPLQEIKTAFDPIKSASSFTEERVLTLSGKIKDLRSLIIKGNS